MLVAIQSRDSDAVQQLVCAGVSPNITVSGRPALHLAASGLYEDTGVLQQLVAAGAALTTSNRQGRTALMSAVLSKDLRIVKQILMQLARTAAQRCTQQPRATMYGC
jgi:ankyrin repeat protein